MKTTFARIAETLFDELPLWLQASALVAVYSAWMIAFGWILCRQHVLREAGFYFDDEREICLMLFVRIPLILSVFGGFALLRMPGSSSLSRGICLYLTGLAFIVLIMGAIATAGMRGTIRE